MHDGDPRRRRGRLVQPPVGQWPVRTGTIAFVPDDDRRRAWTVLVNGVPSSHVDLDDATRLDFEYMRWAGDLLDVLAPQGQGLHVAHVGGAGCTLARYVAATRPDSRQVVFEVDEGVLDAVRKAFGWRSSALLRLRAQEGREAVAALPPASQDVVVRDAFSGAVVPAHLRTRGFLRLVDAALRPDGVYVANLADAPPMSASRVEAATALSVFDHVALLAEPALFKGRRYGNVVVLGSQAALPIAALERRLASGAVRARLLDTDQSRAFAGGCRPADDPEGGT